MLGFREIDQILRGGWKTDFSSIRLLPILVANLLLMAAFGICMGFFGLFARPSEWEYRQVIACSFKVPSLFFLSVLVTFPSLYVFNTLLGSRLKIYDLGKLLASAGGIISAILFGFGPIVAFFSVTTVHYPFVILMNVAAIAIASLLGITHLYRMLGVFFGILNGPPTATSKQPTNEDEIAIKQAEKLERSKKRLQSSDDEMVLVQPVQPDEPSDENKVLESSQPTATGITATAGITIHKQESKIVFYLWTVIFALVGAQMSWILRPFIGAPGLPFEWFRVREGSFFEALGRAVRQVVGF
jgi:hypothetical protein